MKEFAERVFNTMYEELQELKDPEYKEFLKADGTYNECIDYGEYILNSKKWEEFVKTLYKMRNKRKIETEDEIFALGYAFMIN